MEIIKIYLIFSMLFVLWSDARKYIIPNWLVASLLGLYPIAVLMAPGAVDWQMALAAMGIVFVVGYGIFSLRWMGAGDIKLMTACALWIGYDGLMEYLFIMAVLGGALSVVLLLGRKILLMVAARFSVKTLPRMLQDGAPVPYGLAIAGAFLYALAMGTVPVFAAG